jgi:type II secretory pathway predicted ATPase ExeA
MQDSLAPQLSFFHLERDPFAPTADPELFYFTIEYERCIYGLKRSIDARYGIVMILGNYGTGKTSLMRALLAHISKRSQHYQTAIVASPNPAWTSNCLMESICEQFRIEVPRGSSLLQYQNAFNRFLYESRGLVNTLIIDDSQNLEKREHIELLRLLQNLETPQHKLLNLVLFGQLELIPQIQAHPNFAQRVNNAFVLKPMSYEDMKAMIEYRLAKSGCPQGDSVFEEEAYRTIFQYSEGVPREVITICRNSMMIAHRIRREKIPNSVVLYAINHTMAKGLFSGEMAAASR